MRLPVGAGPAARSLYLCLVLAAVCLPSAHGEARLFSSERLVGYWYGEYVKEDGGLVMWVTTRNADGTYQDHFRECRNGMQVREQKEYGAWKLEGGVELVTTYLLQDRTGSFRPEAPGGFYVDPYLIVALSEQEMISQNQETGIRYHTQRVYRDYVFDCLERWI